MRPEGSPCETAREDTIFHVFTDCPDRVCRRSGGSGAKEKGRLGIHSLYFLHFPTFFMVTRPRVRRLPAGGHLRPLAFEPDKPTGFAPPVSRLSCGERCCCCCYC